jgi:uncharacterized membrane protein YhhN
VTDAQLVVLLLTAVAAAANWWSRVTDSDRLEAWSKPVVTILVIVLAALADAPAGQRIVAVVALVLCLGGDVALMPAVDKFVVGLASFLLGHVVFVGLFVQQGLDSPWLGLAAVVLALVLVATAGRRIVSGAATGDPALRIPVTAYLVVISAMTVVGWSTGQPWVIVGSTAFVVSDSVLGWRQFVTERRWMSVTVMVTYHLAIVGLALGV